MNILIVRLGALGDLVHTVPAAAALRRAFPDGGLDWIVEAKHAPFVELVDGIDRVVRLEGASLRAWTGAVRELRPRQYDAALDFQGLMKSAVLARSSGARRVVGFSLWHLREKAARPFYSEVEGPDTPVHVIRKNLRLLAAVGVASAQIEFPLAAPVSALRDEVVAEAAGRPIALVNPGAAWPNKRWPAERFGEVCSFLHDVRGLQPYVVWGPGEEELARAVSEASNGAARVAPATAVPDLLALCRAAALMVSGDTGPLHIAAAAGTPAVGIFGPTDPARNGPWSAADVSVSRYAVCRCSYARRCRRASPCLADISVAEVAAAIQRRLGPGGGAER